MSTLPRKLVELVDELDQEVRSVETARALTKAQVSPELATLTVRALRRLLAGESEQAAQLFETLAEEIRERTISFDS